MKYSLKTCFIAIGMVLFLVLSLISTGSLLAAQKTAQTAQQPRYGGTLTLSDINEGASYGYPPTSVKNTYAFRAVAPAIETLFRIDAAGRAQPWLVENFKENSKALMITLTLRKGIKFHDGTDFDAEAVKWNLDQQFAAKTAGTQNFKSIVVSGLYVVVINLTSWDSTVPSNLAQFLGMMISPTAYKKNGQEWCEKNPVGTGPFQFVSWEKGARLSYKKSPNYWQKGKPYVDKIEFTLVLDALTREMSLKKGELDLMLTLSARNMTAFEKEGYSVVRQHAGSGARVMIPSSLNTNSPMANVKVRQAIQYAIDSQAIVKSIFNNEYEPVNQYLYKGHWGYNPKVAGYPFNPEKAKKLLAEAGYSNGFKTKLTYVAGVDNDQVFAAVQAYLKQVGIDLELDPAQIGRWNSTLTGAAWEGLWVGQMSANPDVVVPLVQFYSGGTAFVSMAKPDDYLKAIQRAVVAPDFKAKQKAVLDIQKLLIDKYALMIPLYGMFEFAVSKTYVHNHGFQSSPNNGAWTPEELWLEK
jgi:peptide/nickel transport system substrate-binding protein